MNASAVDLNGTWIVIFAADATSLATNAQMNDVIAALFENDTNLALFEAGSLAPDIADLRNGVAGILLQKLAQYNMIAAAVIDEKTASQGRFGELMLEMNRGNQFRAYATRDEAIAWLVAQTDR